LDGKVESQVVKDELDEHLKIFCIQWLGAYEKMS
jgi:hypothetical protein